VLPSRSSRSLYGPVSSTRSKPRRPVVSPSLGSFQFITSADLPIRLDDSPERLSRASSIKHPSSPAIPNRFAPTSGPLRVTFIGSFLHRIRRLKSFAKSLLRRHSRALSDHHPILIESVRSLKLEEPNVRFADVSLPPGVYQCVNTGELNASVSSSLIENEPAPSTGTSSVPPSPSWLSRNVSEANPIPNFEGKPGPTLSSPPLSPLDISADLFRQLEPATPLNPRMSALRSIPSSTEYLRCYWSFRSLALEGKSA
jgi:hypothetical protein